MFYNIEERKDCPMRHENGNCLVIGGFCANGVSDEICHGLHEAYEKGYMDGINKKVDLPVIVRCKNCRYYNDAGYAVECGRRDELIPPSPDWFCADSEPEEPEAEQEAE